MSTTIFCLTTYFFRLYSDRRERGMRLVVGRSIHGTHSEPTRKLFDTASDTLSRETRMKEVYWIGDVPSKCELSDLPIDTLFIDGRIPGRTAWANMHPVTFEKLGGEFGLGRGQLYQKQKNGRWLKIAG